MRRVIDAGKRDPLNRLLAGTAGALRARQQLPPATREEPVPGGCNRTGLTRSSSAFIAVAW